MPFFTDNRGMLRRIDDIDSISEGVYWGEKEKHRPPKVYMKNGDDFGIEIYRTTLKAIERANSTIIPAHPGFFAVTYWHQPEEPDGPFIEKQDILGWRVSPEGSVRPIVIDEDSIEMGQTWCIVNPAGTAVEPSIGTYETLDEWISATKAHASIATQIPVAPDQNGQSE